MSNNGQVDKAAVDKTDPCAKDDLSSNVDDLGISIVTNDEPIKESTYVFTNKISPAQTLP
jgi:hypothetical protein